ncbi:hypothetical protein L6452_17584 [Arctium lappa]|uniref:Uncharacterized protein n=1 Tax=Arctium lappa TaxID=4217 RepID=A0ACB9C3S5_ARCLA|nr:hypothetical protein L6452_17584 [Arctium lappa]
MLIISLTNAILNILLRMVSTRSRLCTRADGVDPTTSTADQPGRVEAAEHPPIPPLLGGGPEIIPRVGLASSNPIIREVTPQSEMLATMMLVMNEAMAKQKEFLLKIIEDRGMSNRMNETVTENVVVIGSGGNPTEEPTTIDVRQGRRACSYKSFLCCNPLEFSGSDNPVACMNWIQETEQAFDSSECEEGQNVRFGS